MGQASFYNTSLFKELTIDPEDRSKGIPIRRIWSKNLWKNIDFTEQLDIVRAKTLICAGRHDTQTPIVLNEELLIGIPNSKMVVFEQSGHFPFIEETNRFTSVLEEFFDGG